MIYQGEVGTMYEGARVSDYQARVAALTRKLRAEAANTSSIVREAAKVLRWLSTEQAVDAIGPMHGIYSDAAFALGDDAYLLRAFPHTATGHPAIQLVTLPDVPMSYEIPAAEKSLFRALVSRVSRDHAIADWDTRDGYSVAVDAPVHPSLLRAVTSNRHRNCIPLREEQRREIFVLPAGWRV